MHVVAVLVHSIGPDREIVYAKIAIIFLPIILNIRHCSKQNACTFMKCAVST